ncbi:MAG: hypothetical protein KGK01_02140 [Bradyrhizobium sp.]|nr:hypothetical protein [Bradyrhizobium sp.]MDE2470098.1 hypothetical protein [Bradyrhizobium sp.]
MLIVSLGGLGLILASGEAFAGAERTTSAAHSISRPSIAHSFGHHRGHRADIFWPGVADYGPTYDEPGTEITPPPSGDVHYTYTYDVPWDAVHRFPPNVVPSTRPYVPDCTSQTVTVPREDGAQQSANINVIRCY